MNRQQFTIEEMLDEILKQHKEIDAIEQYEYEECEKNKKNATENIRKAINPTKQKVYENLKMLMLKEQDDQQQYERSKILIRILSELDGEGDHLLKCSLDNTFQWYIRYDAIMALSKIGNKSQLTQLVPVLEDSNIEGEVRSAALKCVSQNDITEIIPTIINLQQNTTLTESWYGAAEALLSARARLGDHSVLREIIALCYDDWSHRRFMAQEALQVFIEDMGSVAKILPLLSPQLIDIPYFEALKNLANDFEDEYVRAWAIDLLAEKKDTSNSGVFIHNLGNEYWRVSNSAHLALVKQGTSSIGALKSIVSNKNNVRCQRLWALATLLQLTGDVSINHYNDIEDLYVKWEFEYPEMVRQTIVKEYARDCEDHSDIRYVIESYLQESDDFKFDNIKSQFIALMKQEQCAVIKILDCGTYNNQGSGTYEVVESDAGKYYMSTIGPFITHVEMDGWGMNTSNSDPSKINQVKQLAKSMGLIWLNKDVLQNIVPGLNVYYFGDRSPLSIRDLLFYWQD